MTPWNILDLDPQKATKKDIKRAYAKKLKVTKPDNDPQGFQALHQAYKQALNIVEFESNRQKSEFDSNKETVAFDNNISIENERHKETEILSTNLNQTKDITVKELDVSADELLSENNLPEKHSFEQEIALLTEKVEIALTQKAKVNNDEHWHFLSSNEYVFDEQFNSKLGEIIFAKVSQYNVAEFETRKVDNPHIRPKTLRFLDNIFDWQSNKEYFCNNFNPQQCDAIFMLLEYAENNIDAGQVIKGAQVEEEQQSDFSPNKIGSVFVFIAIILGLFLLYMS